jgi:hypothetical protein
MHVLVLFSRSLERLDSAQALASLTPSLAQSINKIAKAPFESILQEFPLSRIVADDQMEAFDVDVLVHQWYDGSG